MSLDGTEITAPIDTKHILDRASRRYLRLINSTVASVDDVFSQFVTLADLQDLSNILYELEKLMELHPGIRVKFSPKRSVSTDVPEVRDIDYMNLLLYLYLENHFSLMRSKGRNPMIEIDDLVQESSPNKEVLYLTITDGDYEDKVRHIIGQLEFPKKPQSKNRIPNEVTQLADMLYKQLIDKIRLLIKLVMKSINLTYFKDITSLLKEDSLTKFFIRGIGMRTFSDYMKFYTKKGVDTSGVFLYFDLNEFKKVNEVYKHSGGDNVLRNVAINIRKMLPEGSILVRMGGDEFAAWIPGIDEITGANYADQINKVLLENSIQSENPYNPDTSTVTASIGVYEPKFTQERSLDQHIHLADIASIMAKRTQGVVRVSEIDQQTLQIELEKIGSTRGTQRD